VATDIPPAIDARDGFEEVERRIGEDEEVALANTVNNLQLKLSKDKVDGERDSAIQGMAVMKGETMLVKGGGSGTSEVVLAPNAIQIMQTMMGPNQGSRGTSEPHSSDMIPPLRGMSQIGVSLDNGSDVSMTVADSILGKRMAAEDGAAEASGQKLDLSLALNYSAPVGGKTKERKKGGFNRSTRG
jgi:hypothetical protein